MPNPTQFSPGDRFRVAPLGDRYDNVTGTIREVFTDPSGREQHAHVTHDDGTLTMWQLSRLEQIERELPDLPQRIRGATLTPGYVDAGDPTGALTGEPGGHSESQQEHNEVEKTMGTNTTTDDVTEQGRAIWQALADAGADVPANPADLDATHLVIAAHSGIDVGAILDDVGAR